MNKMSTKPNLKTLCQKILEDNGGKIANQSNKILLEDPTLKNLRPPLEFIAKNWRDPLTPAMMALSCQAVGGNPDETHNAALALSLMNLSFYTWDDIIDKTPSKLFKPTLYGKFGADTALIIGGLASAKAFTILNQPPLEKEKQRITTKMFWSLWANMAHAEIANLGERNKETLTSKKAFWKIKKEAAADLTTCLKLGAIIGNGSQEEISHLGAYGNCLGIILELWKDFHISANLTIELAYKVHNGALPYAILWAKEHSVKVQETLSTNQNAKVIVENFLNTRALHNTLMQIMRLIERAKKELEGVRSNEATQALQLFIEAQSCLFRESLSTLQSNGT